MEGNACYKFSTIRNYVTATGAAPIRTALDIGANVGAVTREMASYFPECHIYGFEPVEEYYRVAHTATCHLPNVKMFHCAVTSRHRFDDDCGHRRREGDGRLKVLKGLPAAGPGWRGGSVVAGGDDGFDDRHYAESQEPVVPIALDDVVGVVEKLEGVAGVDLVKFDCEGCECSSIGCASEDVLRRIRFIVGEYHDLRRFYRVVESKLFKTHHVNLIGDSSLGAFFAENIAERAGVLNPDRTGMRVPRPWLCEDVIEWNCFDRRFVSAGEEAFHSL